MKRKNNELRGDIIIKNSKLSPIRASKKYYVNSTDEYPILFVLAALTKGISIFDGIGDLANKESNRIIEMKKILSQINIKSKFFKGKFLIYGQGMIDLSKKKAHKVSLCFWLSCLYILAHYTLCWYIL